MYGAVPELYTEYLVLVMSDHQLVSVFEDQDRFSNRDSDGLFLEMSGIILIIHK